MVQRRLKLTFERRLQSSINSLKCKWRCNKEYAEGCTRQVVQTKRRQSTTVPSKVPCNGQSVPLVAQSRLRGSCNRSQTPPEKNDYNGEVVPVIGQKGELLFVPLLSPQSLTLCPTGNATFLLALQFPIFSITVSFNGGEKRK